MTRFCCVNHLKDHMILAHMTCRLIQSVKTEVQGSYFNSTNGKNGLEVEWIRQ